MWEGWGPCGVVALVCVLPPLLSTRCGGAGGGVPKVWQQVGGEKADW